MQENQSGGSISEHSVNCSVW